MRRSTLIVIAAAGLATAASAAAQGTPDTRWCGSKDISASFKRVRGSAGAGQVSYRLSLRNRSATTCVVSGLPGLQLLGRHGKALPTQVVPAQPGAGTAARLMLAPGKRASAIGRFSPDVPGQGEPTAGRRCEPTAYRVRVTIPGSGETTIARVAPRTPVCEHGRIVLSLPSVS
jgi:hypothetical protein